MLPSALNPLFECQTLTLGLNAYLSKRTEVECMQGQLMVTLDLLNKSMILKRSQKTSPPLARFTATPQ